MPPLIPCPSCSRHVYSSEPTCPFCKSKLGRRSLGRGLAAAAGAGLVLATAGCPSSGSSTPEPDPESRLAPAYGAVEVPPVDSAETEPDDSAPVDSKPDDSAPVDTKPDEEPDYRESAPKYGAPPPPPDAVKPPK